MTSKERENFLRNAILIVDHSKTALVSLVELYLQNRGQTFEQFVSTNQHEIYHLYNSSRCCQCPPGHNPPRSSRILHQSQMELLFDRSSLKLPCHNAVRRTDDFCCRMPRSCLCTDILDLTLARCLLVNLCSDVFWFSCLQFHSIPFEDFLNHNKHKLYHIWQYNAACCQCPPGYTFPTTYSMLDQNDWMQMFNAVLLPCTNHRKRLNPGSVHSICSVAAATGITLSNLDPSVRRIILQHCCTLWTAVETLVQIRNQDYGHAKEGVMSDNDYNASFDKIERCILDIAKVCNKETQFKQELREAKDGALDQTLFTQYQNYLIETLTRQTDIHQSVADLVPTINQIGKKIAEKSGKMKKLMDENVQKSYDYQELLMERFNQTLVKVKNQTHMEIHCHMTEGTFVETNAIRKFMEWMHMKDVFVIIGSNGSGKSRNGLEILRQFGQTDKDFDLLKVTDFQQVKDIITDERKTVVLLDDVLPFKLCSCKCLINYHIFDLLNAWKCKGIVKIIFTLNSSTMNPFKDILASHRLFKSCCKIDLSCTNFCMSEKEKSKLLFNFCLRNKIDITWDSLCSSNKFRLDGRIVSEIAKTDPYKGYPQSCFLFTSKLSFLQRGIDFFKHPDQSLMDEINSLRDSTDMNTDQNISYALLIYILLDTGGLDIKKVDITKLITIMESCGYSARRRFLINKVIKSAELMDGHFLRKDAQTMVYHIKHTMIYDALAISYYEVNPSAVISVLSFDFIIDLIRLEKDDLVNQQISLIIEKEMFVNLTQQILTIFKIDYKMKSADFIKMLCNSSIILQYNQDFIGILIREFSNCTSQDTVDIRIEGKRDQMSFHFPRALLWFLMQKPNVDKAIESVLHFIETDMKDKQNMKNIEASKKVILACFYYLCELAFSEKSNMKLKLIYGFINENGIECSYDYSIQIALQNGNDPAVSFLLSHVSKEIDIVKLIFEIQVSEDIRKLCNLISETFTDLKNKIDTDDKTDILKILFRSLPMDAFNSRASIKTSCRKLCKDLVTDIVSDSRSFIFDTGNVVNTACENGWEDALKMLLKKKLCNQSEKKQIFTASLKEGMDTFLKWIILTDDSDELDIKDFVLHEFRCENFETVQNFILKLQSYPEMETIVKNLVSQYSLPIIRFIQWVIEDTNNKILTGNTNDLQSLYIVQWIYDRFPDLQTDIMNTVYKTINDSCDNPDAILEWLNENTNVMVHPITTLLEFSCKNNLQKIVKWILQTFDHNSFNIHDLLIETYKAGYKKTTEVVTREVDLNKMDVASIITAMLSTCQKQNSKDMFILFIQNIDQAFCRWMDVITILVDLKLYDYITLVIQHVDDSKFDMMKIVKNKMNDLSEHKLKDLIQSVKQELLDINYIVWAALKIGYHEIVTWLVMDDNKNAINKSELFYKAVSNGNTYAMHYLLTNIDHELLDIEGAVDIACSRGKFDIVEMLLLKVDNKAFDVKAVIDNVFGGITCDTAKTLLDNDNLLEINVDKATECERIKIVKLMLGKFDHRSFDMTTVINTAYEHRWFDLMKWVINEVDNSLLDLNSILIMACQSECLDIVTLIVGKMKKTNVDIRPVMRTVFGHDSVNAIKVLIRNTDISLTDLGEVMNEECHDGNSELVKQLIASNNDKINLNRLIKIACERNWQDLIKFIIQNERRLIFNFDTTMIEACRFRRINIVKWLIQNNTNTSFDFTTVFKDACRDRHIDIVETLIQNVDHGLLGMNNVVDNECRLNNFEQVKWMLGNIDNKLFDIKEAMNNVCSERKLDTVKWLIENVDNTLFDMKAAMNVTCRLGNLDIMKWLIENVDNKSFDLKKTMNNACFFGKLDIVKWLIENVENQVFDMKDAINNASKSDNLDIMKFLIQKIDNKFFEMKNAMNNACKLGNLDIIKWLIENVDNKFFDMKVAMNQACSGRKLDTVKWLKENVDNKLFDMKNAMNHACKWGHLDIVKWLIENINNEVFDMKESMSHACLAGKLDIMKWLIENFDHKFFEMMDMKIAMCKACSSGNLDIVKWLIDNVDNKLFETTYLSEGMNTACSFGHLDIVKWLYTNIVNKFFDIKEALNNAWKGEHIKIFKWLIKNVDIELFDMTEAMTDACTKGDPDIVELVIANIDKFDSTSFNLQSPLNIIFECYNDKCYNDDFDGLVLTICKLGRKQHIFWTDVLNNACVYGFDKVVEWLLTHFPSNVFDFDTAITNAMLSKWNSIIEFIIKHISHTATDKQALINLLCHHGYTPMALWVLKNQGYFVFDNQTVMNEACLHDDLSLVKYLLEKFKPISFDMKTSMIKACRGNKSTCTIEWLWGNTDQRMFDMNVAMTNACRYGRKNVIKWLWENIHQSNFRMNEAFHNGCKHEHEPVVRWMIENVPRELLDMSNALHTACPGNTDEDIVDMIIQNINISSIDINLIIRESCKHGKTSIIHYLLNNTDVKMIDMNQAMTNILSIDVNSDSYSDEDTLTIDAKKQQLAMKIIQKTTLSMLKTDEIILEICKNGWLKLLKFIWSNKDHSNINIDQSKIDIACEYGRKNIVHWAVRNIDLNKINVKALMTESCSYGWLEIVKKIWTIEEKGNFDIQSAMNEGCSYGRVDVVTWLIQNADNNLFDMNCVMESSCRNGWIDIIKDIISLDLSTCNTTIAITAACTSGNVELVQLLISQFGKEIIDFDEISKSIVKSSKNSDLAMFLLLNIDVDINFVSNIFMAACGFGWLNVIEYIKNKAIINCNISGGMIEACDQGEDKIVTYLLQEFPHYPFDFQSSLLASCAKGWDEIAGLLLDTVDHNLLHIEKNFENICRSGEVDIVRIILKKVDHNLLNLNETINTLIKDKKNEQVVLSILKNAHKTKWDKQSLIETAREHSWWKVVAFLNI